MSAQKTSLQYTEKDKWTRMLDYVTANAPLLQPNIQQQFKKLALIRLLFSNILLLLIQYSGLNLSNLSSSTAPVWFATGTACAFLFLRGYSVLPGMWLGNFLAYFLAKVSLGFAIAFATVITAQAVVLFWFSCRYLSPTLIFYQLPRYIKFVAFSALLTAATSLALLFLNILSMPRQENLGLIGTYLWLGNFNAILIFSCAYVTWDAYSLRTDAMKPSARWLRNILYIALLSINITLTLNTNSTATFFLAPTSVLVIVVISFYFGWCGAMAATFLSAILLSFTPFHNILFLQLLLCVQTILGLSIAIPRKKHW